jgi:hypothetical protein
MTKIRFVDVDVTQPLFAGLIEEPYGDQLMPEIDLGPDERIVSITEHHSTSGLMGSYIALRARVWITSP